MISVQSLQRLSSGSKIMTIVMLTMLLMSCFSTRKTVINEPAKKPTKPKVDTMVFVEKENPNVIKEVEIVEEKPAFGRYEGLIQKQNYNILVLAPFRNERFVRFYTGFKTAGSNYQGPLSISVTAREFENGSISDADLSGVDLIVGPYRPNDIQQVSSAIASRNIILISPWLTNKNAQAGEHYVELGANMDMHLRTLLTEASSSCEPSQMMIIGRRDHLDQQLVDNITTNIAPSLGIGSEIPTFFVDDVNSSTLMTSLQSEFATHGTRCVFVPHWKDKIFLHTLIGRISAAKGSRDITLYAMPQVLEIEDMDYTYLENLHTVVSTTKVPLFKQASDFNNSYYQNYSTFPDKEVYYGRDNFYLAADLLEKLSMSQTGFTNIDCVQCLNSIDLLEVDGAPFSYDKPLKLQNNSVNLLRFENYEFHEIRR